MTLREEVAETYSKAERVVIALLPRYAGSEATWSYAQDVLGILQQLRTLALDGAITRTELPPRPPPPPPPVTAPSPPSEPRSRVRLSRDQWAVLLPRARAGESKTALAAEFGVSRQAIVMQLARERGTT